MLSGAGPSPPEVFRALLEEEAPSFGLSLSGSAIAALARFLSELDEWRRKTNLTGRLTPRDLASHALESALGEKLIPHGVEVLDIGSGGGFPGLPLAIVRSDLHVTPLEPRRKRAAFLRHVVRSLPVENAFVLEDRIERIGVPSWNVATVRAVGRVAQVIDDAPFLKAEGALLVWTTESESLSGSLAHAFSLKAVLPVPGAKRRQIALFRKRGK